MLFIDPEKPLGEWPTEYSFIQFVGLICSSEGLDECTFEVQVKGESLWSHQIGFVGVYTRQLLLKSVG